MRARIALCLAAWLAGCAPDSPTAVPGLADVASGKVNVCHMPQAVPAIIEVASSALAAHIAHGDYVTTLRVSHETPAPGDTLQFRRITDALSVARAGRLARGEHTAAACPITITVSPGRYAGTATGTPAGDIERFPIVVDVPAIILRGSTVLPMDPSDRPGPEAVGGIETVLAPVEPLTVVNGSSTPIIIANGHPSGSAGNALTVEGFVFQSGNTGTVFGGQALLSLRVTSISFRRNRVEGGFTEKIDLRASSGDVTQNYLSGAASACDICLAAPGTYRAISNRVLAGGVPGITTSAVVGLPVPADVEPYVLPATAEVWSEVRNNEVRDHLSAPVGVGIRVEVIGTMAPHVRNTVHSSIRDNLLVNNRFGIMIHAGFPVAGTDRIGIADVSLSGNVIQQSCQAKLLISLVRHQRTLGLNATFPYLQSSVFLVALNGNVAWDEVWYGHEAGFGNTLIVDGAPVANGSRHFYSPAGCPGL